MLIIPAVDIFRGKCVRLVGGNPAESRVYFDDPVEAARMWEDQGAQVIHIVDLDAAMDMGDNLSVVKKILEEVSVETQVGGGIRSIGKAIQLCNLGATRVILGTLITQKPKVLTKLIKQLGSARIVAALDYSSCRVVSHGWKTITDLSVFSLAKKLASLGIGWILFSSIERDGSMSGPDLQNIRKMVRTVSTPIIASGGVGSLRDVVDVAKTGVAGLVIGRALYEKVFTLQEVWRELSRC